ncbi:hypothetical protein BU24DRAFT_155586 [Aaosphaeria arxii CBS 175.79]|uniref:Amidohydrolase-related domain-containing protein n=1 Tax=Aaosphaeria arxii CBS 175.79 TaxID=1450172 RepID=A0A6A5XXI9_9PLEO|nr:uncharacterized protein BU24DRAFT_155586 [Aaosphaeria arxii CBS 175.79]KAF2017669.1 hypothetical protein BU24DRAFT_155586 [Aaosphaeria arxii CBS 175.79]
MSKILDTHIHLWPSTATTSKNHGWMQPGHFLSKRHGISDYLSTTHSTSPPELQPSGFIYVETDRYLPSSAPDVPTEAPESELRNALVAWAKEPLAELEFLRRIVEGSPDEGDGFEAADAERMKGCVIWAPFHLESRLFDLYIRVAEEVAGPRLWAKVVGFRYLLQGINDEGEMRALVGSQRWVTNLLSLRRGRGGRGWAFDVGVDTHGGGIWQLDVAAGMIDKIRGIEANDGAGNVAFVLNHLCKPDLSSTPSSAWPDFRLWKSLLTHSATQPAVYMKFSGAFNEFAPSPTPSSVSALKESLGPFIAHIVDQFGTGKVMFGSDWPVCNVGGPNGEENWGLWRELVAAFVEEAGDDIWWRAGCEAYGIMI